MPDVVTLNIEGVYNTPLQLYIPVEVYTHESGCGNKTSKAKITLPPS